MRRRFFCLAASIVALLFACSIRGNAQYFTYGFYQIVDNTGTTLSSSTGAGFNVAGCGATSYGVGCGVGSALPPFSYFNLPFQLGISGNPICATVPAPPLPFAEYDETLVPNVATCYSGSLYIFGPVVSPGTPRCPPGQSSDFGSYTSPCYVPFIFTATPSAVSSAAVKLVPSQWHISYPNDGNQVVPCLEPDGGITCSDYPVPDGSPAGTQPFVKLIYAPPITCIRFLPPFENALTLPKGSKRAIPIIMQLFDQNNALVTPTTLNAVAPIVDVMYSSSSTPGADVSSTELLPESQASTGNQFSFDATTNTWQYHLDTSQFMASGTYTVSVRTGDGSQYAMSPTCSQTFTRP
jgi:hypothetical protein